MRKLGLLLALTLVFNYANAQSKQQASTQVTQADKPSKKDYKYFALTSYYSFTNWLQVGNAPNIHMYELHLGKRIDSKNIIGVKMATMKLFEPLGIQAWNPNILQESEWFSGRIQEYGVGVFYQRTLWKGLYASIEVMPMLKVFLDENNNKIENGFRLYSSYHLGYYIPLFKNRLFIKPQIHCNYWPINSKGPEGFKEQVEKHDNYFLFEPNIYIGINF